MNKFHLKFYLLPHNQSIGNQCFARIILFYALPHQKKKNQKKEIEIRLHWTFHSLGEQIEITMPYVARTLSLKSHELGSSHPVRDCSLWIPSHAALSLVIRAHTCTYKHARRRSQAIIIIGMVDESCSTFIFMITPNIQTIATTQSYSLMIVCLANSLDETIWILSNSFKFTYLLMYCILCWTLTRLTLTLVHWLNIDYDCSVSRRPDTSWN